MLKMRCLLLQMLHHLGGSPSAGVSWAHVLSSYTGHLNSEACTHACIISWLLESLAKLLLVLLWNAQLASMLANFCLNKFTLKACVPSFGDMSNVESHAQKQPEFTFVSISMKMQVARSKALAVSWGCEKSCTYYSYLQGKINPLGDQTLSWPVPQAWQLLHVLPECLWPFDILQMIDLGCLAGLLGWTCLDKIVLTSSNLEADVSSTWKIRFPAFISCPLGRKHTFFEQQGRLNVANSDIINPLA